MSQAEVSRKSPIPIYHQIKELLKERIESGFFDTHECLPSERELGEMYGISRMTARRALKELEGEGYVYREQGKGSFVAEPKLRQALLHLTSFTEDMRKRGLDPGAKVLENQVIEGDKELVDKLGVLPEEKFVRLQRVRLADGEPLAIETSFLRRKFCPELEEIDFNNESLYRVLNERYGIDLGRAEQTVEATLSGEFETQILNIEKAVPMLSTERITYLTDGETVIEYARSTYRADRYKLYVELRR